MTNQEVHRLLAGPALDALVAAHLWGGAQRCDFRCPVCGSRLFGSTEVAPGRQYRCCHGDGNRQCRYRGPADECLPWYSRSPQDADAVLVRLRDVTKTMLRVEYWPRRVRGTLWLFPVLPSNVPYAEATGDTAALVLCRLALQLPGQPVTVTFFGESSDPVAQGTDPAALA